MLELLLDDGAFESDFPKWCEWALMRLHKTLLATIPIELARTYKDQLSNKCIWKQGPFPGKCFWMLIVVKGGKRLHKLERPEL